MSDSSNASPPEQVDSVPVRQRIEELTTAVEAEKDKLGRVTADYQATLREKEQLGIESALYRALAEHRCLRPLEVVRVLLSTHAAKVDGGKVVGVLEDGGTCSVDDLVDHWRRHKLPELFRGGGAGQAKAPAPNPISQLDRWIEDLSDIR
jgi:hypothetical protein